MPMGDPNTKDPILRTALLYIDRVLDQADKITQSVSPRDKWLFRRAAKTCRYMLREDMPSDAFGDRAELIPLAANDPALKVVP